MTYILLINHMLDNQITVMETGVINDTIIAVDYLEWATFKMINVNLIHLTQNNLSHN